ncbi:MAG TPA: ComEC/Rec2 family competence protein, partial [Bacteroidia bacterium]|nr:ComEC/Rec2 family competence protein [Bacteroidia bacterium]
MNKFIARIPLVRLLIPFVTGIALSYSSGIRIGLATLITLIFISAVVLFLHRKLLQKSLKWIGLDGMIISIAFLVLGIGISSQQFVPDDSAGINRYEKISALNVRLLNDPVVKDKSVKLFVEVCSEKDGLSWKASREKMLVYLERENNSGKLKYGDELLICASPVEIEGPKNPEEFDYREWLKRQGVYGQAYAGHDSWKIISRGNGNWFKSAALDLRSYFLNKLQEYGLSGSSYGVAAALLLGASDHLDPGTIQAYSASGTLHVLSVSGMHVALVYVVLLKLLLPLQKRRGGKWISIFLQLIFLWFYATLTGLCPSVLRSVTMLSVVIAGRAFNKNAHILNSLAASAFILLISDPMLLFDIGFQLSYLAVGGIVILQPELLAVWEPDTNTFSGKIMGHVWTLVSVTLVAQVFTFPLGLYYFHQFPAYFLISNLVVIPLSTIVMYAGLALLIVSPFAIIARPIAILFSFLVQLLNGCVTAIEHFPHSVIHSAKWEKSEMTLMYCGIIFFLIFILKNQKRFLQLGLSSFLLLLIFVGCDSRKILEKKEMIIFSLNHSTGILVVNGSDHVLFADTSLLKRKGDIDFHIEPFLKANGMEEEKIVSLNDSAVFKNNFVHEGKNFLMSCGKRIAIAGRNFNADASLP